MLDLLIEFVRKSTKQSGVRLEVQGRGANRRVFVTSFDGIVDYQEEAPSFAAAHWAAWWAFRVLHPDKLFHFDVELRELFEDYKKNGSAAKWLAYNDDKRAILARYLREPYEPKKRRKRK